MGRLLRVASRRSGSRIAELRSIDFDASERYANSEGVARRYANMVADGALIA
jgi:hypothetical protein